MFTPHQSAYFANWLTQTGKVENRVSRAMASARVDMNPHQIEAARFALKSPLEKGVLLADEVGLGKTIEASLVMAQKWAEGKRNILLVVPASLRKQWSQELQDKFELPSIIIDSKVAAALKKEGIHNPFSHECKIVICSYEYVARQKEKVQLVDWHLVVFDEAHKLRNIYQNSGSKRAKTIVEATQYADSRVLLSATPIQNKLMELYGLSQVIDAHYFGDAKSFRKLYVNRQNDKQALEDLKQRIEPLCHRTLRRQVQQEGGISFTNRYSLTQDFTPLPEEWELYQKLSHYLQDPNIQAISHQAKHLVSMGLRKILASSSFAVADTLKGMVERLKDKQLLNEEALSDIEEADDWLDAEFGDDETQATTKTDRLQHEIEQLTEFQSLAQNISENAKGNALLTVLEKAMAMTESLGGQRKAVVFTESCRTQRYLNDLLEGNDYRGRTVLLNGSNADSRSKAIYKEWLEEHRGSARISGSKPADMKAALVDCFKSEKADILVSTEAGGEGINLQFCSVLINYDLPWNPQKVEQRIGRVHRYGQKNDVVVVNFVNRKNPADQRVFQLLNEKLKLFEGVFGASDEILGAIEGNIDIERRIYDIYQKCRTDAEIEQEFDQLQESLKDILDVREAEARQTLLNDFDRDVVATLRTLRDESNDFLQEYERVLLDLARAELPAAIFNTNHFVLDGQRYDLSWPLVEQNNSEFFRLQATKHHLAWELVRKAKSYRLESAHLIFQYDQMEGQYAALKVYLGQSGTLTAFEIRFSYNRGKDVKNQLVVLAKTDSGELLTPGNAEHLLFVPAYSKSLERIIDENEFADYQAQVIDEQTLQTEAELDNYLEQESDKLERWADDRRKVLMETVDELAEDIHQLKKASRQLASTAEKIQAKKELRKLERKRDDALHEYHESRKVIEQEEDRLLDEVAEKLELTCEVRNLFTIRWTLTH
ncbi:helicase-like protein [Marinobacter sp. LV10R520-4]|uniref:SNF2-related protein n=2 Tax=unclassified Marinobacter TaxID=83889 RepID=UPI000BF4D76B|nr:SNF2-related protein [Marinobacter sp. LV10R520-4]PFG53670.1 helicase-like protein [Marinobacter sp. LV10R520-4]